MDYEGLYQDLMEMQSKLTHAAAVWMLHDEVEALKRLRLASECLLFSNDLFLRGHGR